MNTFTEAIFTRAAVLLFLTSIVVLLFLLKVPNYGGDELLFATPLLVHSIQSLQLFEFEYGGPLKTVLTWPIFKVFGFNIVSVRLFSVTMFVLMAVAWCGYLRFRALHIAAAATLAFLALNPDLQFFARDDINQPTLQNLVMTLHLLAFLAIVERGPSALNAAVFTILSYVDVNNHIRNVWLCNALALAFVLDYVSINGLSTKSVLTAVKRGWPVLLGWAVGAAEFAYVYWFNDSLNLEAAKVLGNHYTWWMRMHEVFITIPQLISGSRVMREYGVGAAFGAAGAVMIVMTVVAWVNTLRTHESTLGLRILRISVVIWLAVIAQFAVTKSAIWAWHGNSVMLFWAITFGLTVQALWTADKKKMAIVYLIFVLGTFSLGRFILERSIVPSVSHQSSFALGVWNSQCLDQVRDYIRNHPGIYIFADWSIGRALPLELHYSPQAGTVAWPLQSMSDMDIQTVRADQVVLRAIGSEVTVPDISDARLETFQRMFKPSQTFKDDAGREAYQLGHILPSM